MAAMQAVCPMLIRDLLGGRQTLKFVTLALAATIALALSAGMATAQPIYHHHHHRHHVVRHHHHVVRHHRVTYRHHHHHHTY
jgi:Spy/CpxP family protein refolding chaperone